MSNQLHGHGCKHWQLCAKAPHFQVILVNNCWRETCVGVQKCWQILYWWIMYQSPKQTLHQYFFSYRSLIRQLHVSISHYICSYTSTDNLHVGLDVISTANPQLAGTLNDDYVYHQHILTQTWLRYGYMFHTYMQLRSVYIHTTPVVWVVTHGFESIHKWPPKYSLCSTQ